MNELINFRTKNTHRICKLVDNEGNIIVEDDAIFTKLANEFRVSNKAYDEVSDVEINEYRNKYIHENPDYKIPEITEDEIVSAIFYVKKSNDSDKNIPRKFIKGFYKLIMIPLLLLFNNIFRERYIPDIFKQADVTPLYKGKGSKTQTIALYSLVHS